MDNSQDMEYLKFGSVQSDNVLIQNNSTTASSVIKTRVLQSSSPLVPNQVYKLIVEGTGRIVITTQNLNLSTSQKCVTLNKPTLETHVYRLTLKSEAHGGYVLIGEEESRPDEIRQSVWVDGVASLWLLMKVEGNITLVTITTQGGEQNVFPIGLIATSRDGELSSDIMSFRPKRDPGSFCFGDRNVTFGEEITLTVSRILCDGFCRITTIPDPAGYREAVENLRDCSRLRDILGDHMTSQITVTFPVTKTGRPLFLFSGCSICLQSDNGSQIDSEETDLKQAKPSGNSVDEQLQQITKSLCSMELKLNQKAQDENSTRDQWLSLLCTVESETKANTESLLDIRDQQTDMMNEVKKTGRVVDTTHRQVKAIATRFNKGRDIPTEGDRSLQTLSKYINRSITQIVKSLHEAEFIDYLLQYAVITGPQHDDIMSKNAGAERCRKSMEILRKKPDSYLGEVRKALQKSGNDHLMTYFQD